MPGATSMAAFGQGYMTFVDTAAPLTHNGVPTGGMEVSFIWNASADQSLSIGANPWSTLSSLSGGWSVVQPHSNMHY